jgi:hypothetical protein
MFDVLMIIDHDSFTMVFNSKEDVYEYLDQQFVLCRSNCEFIVYIHEREYKAGKHN